MKKIISLLLTLALAPVFAAAQQDSGSFSSFLLLQKEAPGDFELGEIPMPQAAPDFDFDKSSVSGPCCSSSVECAKVKRDGAKALGADGSLGAALSAFNAITENHWYVTFTDGKPLTDGSVGSMFISRKTFIGAYAFDIKAMAVNITWNAELSANLSVGGVSTQKIKKVCFAKDRVTVVAGLGTIGVGASPRTVTVLPSPNSGTDKPVTRTGYVLLTKYGEYLFTSNGK